MRAGLFAAVAVVSLMPFTAQASLIYDLRSGGSAATTSGTGYNRAYSFDVGSVGMTMSAWATTGSGGRLQSAQAQRFDSGVGVCNRREGLNCGTGSHQVDNSNGGDFLLFSFDSAVEFKSIVIDPYGVWDRDVTYFVAELDSVGSLAGLTLSALAAQWDTSSVHVFNGIGIGPLTLNLAATGKHLLFGAYSGSGNILPDSFKVRSLTVEKVAQVPEPGSFALLGTALAGLGLGLRRARSRKA